MIFKTIESHGEAGLGFAHPSLLSHLGHCKEREEILTDSLLVFLTLTCMFFPAVLGRKVPDTSFLCICGS